MPTSFLNRFKDLPTFWQLIVGSVALHALIVGWMVWQSPRALPQSAPRVMEVEVELDAPKPLAATVVPVAAPKKPLSNERPPLKPRRTAKVRAPKTKTPVAKPIVKPRPPVVAPQPRPTPIVTQPPPRERTTPVIAPTTPQIAPNPNPIVPDITPPPAAPLVQPVAPVAAPTTAPAPSAPARSNVENPAPNPATGGGGSGGGGGGGGTPGDDGLTSGTTTSGGTLSGGVTSGGTTSGGTTSGGVTSGGTTSGGVTSGGTTSGGVTSGGTTSGGVTSGGVTSGGVTSGGPPSGGAGPYGLPGGGQNARRIVYLLDVSPSMIDHIGRAKAELNGALQRLVPGELFNIIAFDANNHSLAKTAKTLVPANAANLARARQWLDGLEQEMKAKRGNGTNVLSALRQGLQAKDVNAIILISDGEPTVGIKNFNKIADKVRQLNRTRARIDAVGLTGFDPAGKPEPFVARPLLEQLARESGGEFVSIQDNPPPAP